MRLKNKFVLIQGVELVFRRGEWVRVPTTILYTGKDAESWMVVGLPFSNGIGPTVKKEPR